MEIGFIGLGTMGSRMAANLIKGGHQVWAHDISAAALARASEQGATPCHSAREASQGRDAVIMSLTSPSVVEQVALGPEGVLAASPVPALLIDTSSSLPAVTKRIAAAAQAKGCQMVDAPVSGGPEGAAAATLSIMVGASPETFERALPLLRLLGRDIFRIGDVGAGHAMKLVNNILGGVTMAAVAEALMLGTLAGIEPKTIFEVVSASTGNSKCFQNRAPRVLKGDFEPGFAVELMHKDLDLATQLGRELGMPMPIVNAAREIYQTAKAQGLGQKDFGALAMVLERLMGVEIRDRK